MVRRECAKCGETKAVWYTGNNGNNYCINCATDVLIKENELKRAKKKKEIVRELIKEGFEFECCPYCGNTEIESSHFY